MASAWRALAGQAMRIAVREGPKVLRQVQQARARGQQQSQRASGGPGTHHSAPRAPREARAPTDDGAPAQEVVPRPAHGSTARTGAPQGRHLDYAPDPDDKADPGEVVWTWVQYEEDASQGKDRPVLVVGREDTGLLGLMLSSQHSRDGQQGWFSLGSGPWDREGRPSWLRLDRVLDVPEEGIRREGAVLDRDRFDQVAEALRSGYGWA